MLEVCFGDSMKGALCWAQCGGQAVCSSAIGLIFFGDQKPGRRRRRTLQKRYRRRQAKLLAQAIPLGGKPEDIVSVSFDLSYGDIAQPIMRTDCPRRRYVFDWLTTDPWNEQEEAESELERFWQSYMDDMEKLTRRAGAGEAVRIWADETPAAACGLRFVAALLRDAPCGIMVVPLPQEERQGGTVVRYASWGEVAPERFGALADSMYVMTDAHRQQLAAQWRTLQRENAPLRAVQHGQVVSVPLDYYDALLLEECPQQPCTVAWLIGTVLGKRQPGVGDWLLAQRVRALLEDGQLRVVRRDARFYATEITAIHV